MIAAKRPLIFLLSLALGCSSDDEASPTAKLICDATLADESVSEVGSNPSCALSCSGCEAEVAEPWQCAALAPWPKLPHDCAAEACGKWNGKHPKPVSGKCSASAPSGDAVAKASPTAKPIVLPDGRRLVPAGIERPLDDPKAEGTFPASALWLPGTRFVLVSDNGYEDHALRVLDAQKLAADQDPIVSEVIYERPDSLNYGLAVAPDGTLYAASGAPDSVIRAFSIDAAGQLTKQPTKDIAVQNTKAGDVYPSGIAISPDGKRLAVAQVDEQFLLVYSLESADYGKSLAAVDLGGQGAELLSTYFDPASSDVVYVTAWNGHRLFEVNLASVASPIVRSIETGKQPEQVAFISPTHLVVANSLSDDLSIVDRPSAKVVSTVPVDPNGKLHGHAPTALAFDATSGKLYATLAGTNGLAVFDVKAGTPPVVSPLGYLPTGWWPTAVALANVPGADPLAGSLMVLSGRGHGIGPEPAPQGFAQGVNGLRMKGSALLIAPSDQAKLADFTLAWESSNQPGALAGRSEVSCPDGAEWDFPIPKDNQSGPSAQIKNIIYIVRENKTFDAIMGDMPGADGDPSLVMAPGKMDQVWGNIRKVAKEFAHADNFYEDAEQSIQGHYWTVFGRTSDYTERAWLSIWGRSTRSLTVTVSSATHPVEGGVFQWLEANGIEYDNMGELIGNGKQDPRYGIVSTSNTRPDTKGACYIAARARMTCDLRPFTYVWLVNDHTFGGAAGMPNPGLMIAVNDEATGMIIDGISHGPAWKHSLVVVIEDDPSDGADHVDAHRSIAVFASPWVKRGYVTKTHFDVSSLHKLFAHILGIPYNNYATENAALPLDLFTSTPDYTPYEYLPRTWNDLSCNSPKSPYAIDAEERGWDFADPDEQPGLSSHVWHMLRETK